MSFVSGRVVIGATDKVFHAGHYGWHITFNQRTYGAYETKEQAEADLKQRQQRHD